MSIVCADGYHEGCNGVFLWCYDGKGQCSLILFKDEWQCSNTESTCQQYQSTSEPTIMPTGGRIIEPPLLHPTTDPTLYPIRIQTQDPTTDPTTDPTSDPTDNPTIDPSVVPTQYPSLNATKNPSSDPTSDPTTKSTGGPDAPSLVIPSINTPTSTSRNDGAAIESTEVLFTTSFDKISSANMSTNDANMFMLIILIIGSVLCCFVFLMVWYIIRLKKNQTLMIEKHLAQETKDHVAVQSAESTVSAIHNEHNFQQEGDFGRDSFNVTGKKQVNLCQADNTNAANKMVNLQTTKGMDLTEDDDYINDDAGSDQSDVDIVGDMEVNSNGDVVITRGGLDDDEQVIGNFKTPRPPPRRQQHIVEEDDDVIQDVNNMDLSSKTPGSI